MQGFHDFVLFGTVALASLMSGAVYNAFGWSALNWVALPATLLCVLALSLLPMLRRQAAAGA